MTSRVERKGENESFFRELNERLEQQATEKRASDGTFQIVCECSLEACTERLAVPFGDYESVREDGTRFILAPGHADLRIEHIVRSTADYDVVEKVGAAAEVVTELDPRNDGTDAACGA